MNAANGRLSLYCTHCSLTEKSTKGNTAGIISLAFLSPIDRLRECALAARKLMKFTASALLKPRPFLLSLTIVSVSGLAKECLQLN